MVRVVEWKLNKMNEYIYILVININYTLKFKIRNKHIIDYIDMI